MSHRAERQARQHLTQAGFLVVRAAGSMGTVDLAAHQNDTLYLIEVKASSTELADGTRVFRMSDHGGKGLEQRDALRKIQEQHPETVCGFLLKAKGRHLPDHVSRWTWHSVYDIGSSTVLRSDDGVPMGEAFGLEVPA